MREYLNPVVISDLEVIRGHMLSVDTVKMLKDLYTDLTVEAATVDCSGNPDERYLQDMARSVIAGKRALIEELLTRSENAAAQLAMANSQSQS